MFPTSFCKIHHEANISLLKRYVFQKAINGNIWIPCILHCIGEKSTVQWLECSCTIYLVALLLTPDISTGNSLSVSPPQFLICGIL